MASYTEEAKFGNLGGDPIYWDAVVTPTSSPVWPGSASININKSSGVLLGGGSTETLTITLNNKGMDADADPYFANLNLAAYTDEERTKLFDSYQWSIRVNVAKGILVLTGDTINFEFLEGDTVIATDGLTLNNTGSLDLAWTSQVTGDGAVVGSTTIAPSSGDLNAGDNEPLAISTNPTGLTQGSYSGEIEVDSDDADPTAKEINILVNKLYALGAKCLWHLEVDPYNPDLDITEAPTLDWADGLVPAGSIGWGKTVVRAGVNVEVVLYRTGYTWYIKTRATGTGFIYVTEVVSPTFREVDGYPMLSWTWTGIGKPGNATIFTYEVDIGPNVW